MTQEAQTTVRHIGSRWAGQENGSIKDLLKLIAIEPLDEKWYPYCSINQDGSINIGGNFERISHGFSLNTNDHDLLANFAAAFEDNRRIDKMKLKADVPKSTLVLMGIITDAA